MGISTYVVVMPRLEVSGGSITVDRLGCRECAAGAGWSYGWHVALLQLSEERGPVERDRVRLRKLSRV